MRHCRAACADFTPAERAQGMPEELLPLQWTDLRQPKQSAGFTVLSTYLVHVKKKLMG